MMLASILLYFFLTNDKIIERYEGFILLSLLVIFLFFLIKIQKIIFQKNSLKLLIYYHLNKQHYFQQLVDQGFGVDLNCSLRVQLHQLPILGLVNELLELLWFLQGRVFLNLQLQLLPLSKKKKLFIQEIQQVQISLIFQVCLASQPLSILLKLWTKSF